MNDLAPDATAWGADGTSKGLAVSPVVHAQARHQAWEVGTDLSFLLGPCQPLPAEMRLAYVIHRMVKSGW